jgi:hypothetical protein
MSDLKAPTYEDGHFFAKRHFQKALNTEVVGPEVAGLRRPVHLKLSEAGSGV